MARIAFICPPFAAHLASFRALGEALQVRGHEPFFLLNAGASGAVGDIPIHHVPARDGDPEVGRVLVEEDRSDYRKVSCMMLPFRVVTKLSGQRLADLTIDSYDIQTVVPTARFTMVAGE